MRKQLVLAAAAAAVSIMSTVSAGAQPSGEINVWSWNIAAEALDMLVPDFNKKYPGVKVTVANMGHNDVRDKALAGCAAGGTDMPDVVTIENSEAEVYWARFPDCFADLTEFGVEKYKDAFAPFKWAELSVGDAVYSLPWDSGPAVMFYRRDIYEQAGVDPASIRTWDDYLEAGKTILAATGGKVKMATINISDDDAWFRPLANQQGCSYFDPNGESVTVNQPGCVAALEILKKLSDAGILALGDWGGQIQNIKTGAVATSFYGGWYEGTIRSNAPELEGKWGVYEMPAAAEGGVRAANWGGSSLAITSASDNKEAAWAFIEYALATNEGQISMLRNRGLVPSLLSSLDDPYVKEAQPYWGGQPVWSDILATMNKIPPYRGTQFYQETRATVMIKSVTDYLNGGYPSAKEALDEAASQISTATGLPIAQ
jgi:lactose/L-arabinose transport system substrate-binding protein